MPYLVICGPQAAGKTTALSKFDRLRITFGETIVLRESRDILKEKNKWLGAIFMTKRDEEGVIDIDLKRLAKIAEDNSPQKLYIDECSIFTLAHAVVHGVHTREYLKDYLSTLERLDAKFLFLDVRPEISWNRRKDSYATRTQNLPQNEREATLREYQRYMATVYEQLIAFYDKVPFEKRRIRTEGTKQEAEKEIARSLQSLLPN